MNPTSRKKFSFGSARRRLLWTFAGGVIHSTYVITVILNMGFPIPLLVTGVLISIAFLNCLWFRYLYKEWPEGGWPEDRRPQSAHQPEPPPPGRDKP